MGSAFWLYGFGRIQPYPLTKYFNYMDHPVYRQTVSGIRANTRLMRIIGAGMEWLRYGKSTQNSRKKWWSNRVISIHIRRGDYWNKCRKIEDPILRAKCYPSAHDIVAALYKVSGTFSWMTVLSSRFRPIVYVATNSHDVKKELESAKKRYQFVYFEDVFPSSSFGNEIPLDPINSALIDIELCSLTDAFVGNIFSSFSRSIFEKRELSGKPFTTF
ncbi:hypothetical protein BC829DRAFT_141603 [Chytridium lagenaria]|nr:hypothetical protein BC829DRAFT_141603 [Chytridium lagenaria]